MSNLLSQASLVMIPSGYKEDVVYSQIPTNGNGDLSFTRASNGTRINSAGLVEVCPWNLLEQSESIGTSPWTTPNVSVTSGQTDPNGGSTAFLVVESTDGGSLRQAITQTGQLCYSIVLKYSSGTNKKASLFCTDANQQAGFDLEFGTVAYVSGSTATIESLGNGWYKCAMTFTPSTASTLILFPNYESGVGGVFVWHPQLNIGATAKPYFPTTDRLNVPRLTYQNGGGGCPSLLLEKQSSNVLLYSEQFDQASWLKGNISVTANNTTSPDGTQNADKVTNTNSSAVYLYQKSQNSASTWSYSFYAKKGTNKYLGVSLCSETYQATSRYQPVFDLDNGTLQTINQSGSNETNTSYSINSVGNGWYKITASFTLSAGADFTFIVFSSSNNTSYNPASGNLDWSNATIGDYYLWGVQAEVSSYPTSYIPTTSSSATRVADACFKYSISSLIGQSQGTLFVDVDFTHSNSGSNEYLAQIREDSGNRILLFRSSSTFGIGVVVLRSGGTIFSNVSSVSTNSRHKVAIAYKSGDLAFYIDGVQIATNSTTFTAYSSISAFDLGSNTTGGSPVELGDYNYNEAILFPTRLTNAELASLTTI